MTVRRLTLGRAALAFALVLSGVSGWAHGVGRDVFSGACAAGAFAALVCVIVGWRT